MLYIRWPYICRTVINRGNSNLPKTTGPHFLGFFLMTGGCQKYATYLKTYSESKHLLKSGCFKMAFKSEELVNCFYNCFMVWKEPFECLKVSESFEGSLCDFVAKIV